MKTVKDLDNPPVSIIIPCFNRAEYLRQTISSALGQTYAPIEVIVVDDGSTDASARIAAEFPVQLIKQANTGVAAALNVGFAASTGALLSALGSDDLMDAQYVDACVRALLADPGAGFAYTQMKLFGAVNRLYRVLPFDPETLAENDYVPAAFLMRREAYERAGPFDTVIPRCEDWDLLLTMAEQGMRGVFVERPLFFYRQHRKSYNSHNFASLDGLRREVTMAARLQDRHPNLLAPRALRRRLRQLPRRLVNGHVSLRHAALLVAFYGAMLARPVIGKAIGSVHPAASLR